MDEKKLDLKLSYDANNDVLYCSFGEPHEAYSVETEDGVFIRLNPETDFVVGITITDFFKKFTEHPGKMLSFPMRPDVAFRLVEK
jgi:uncharacterized protein YuzE